MHQIESIVKKNNLETEEDFKEQSANIDELDRKILKLITANARIPFLEVARECGVSGAAIHQRVQRLAAIGVVTGSEFIVSPQKLGYNTTAYMVPKLFNRTPMILKLKLISIKILDLSFEKAKSID